MVGGHMVSARATWSLAMNSSDIVPANNPLRSGVRDDIAHATCRPPKTTPWRCAKSIIRAHR
jgi:hypothetical protein